MFDIDAIKQRNPGLTDEELIKRLKEETAISGASGKPKMVKCPGCDLMLPREDLRALMEHVDRNHPEIITERRRGL